MPPMLSRRCETGAGFGLDPFHINCGYVYVYVYVYIYMQFSQSLWIYPQLDTKWIAPPLPLSSPGKTTGIKISCAEPWFWRDQQPMYLCMYVCISMCLWCIYHIYLFHHVYWKEKAAWGCSTSLSGSIIIQLHHRNLQFQESTVGRTWVVHRTCEISSSFIACNFRYTWRI